MGDGGTGVAPDTDRCPSCGHLLDRECGCGCCIVAYCDCICWPDRQAMLVCAGCGRPTGTGHAMFCAGNAAGMVADDGV